QYVQSTYHGILDIEKSMGTELKLVDTSGKQILIPREEIVSQYSHNISIQDLKTSTAPLKKNEARLSNLIPGDKIRVNSTEKTSDGQVVTREFTGEYQGIDSEFIVLKRPNDLAPIYISQFDVNQQKVIQLKQVKSKTIPIEESKRKWLPVPFHLV
ncbi:MAG: hypothetical protein ACLGGX_12845, partial [Bdellovibrionia bacterium]